MSDATVAGGEARSWTRSIRNWVQGKASLETMLPDEQPTFVASWVYVFGVVTVAALIWVVISGLVLAFFGPQWWHENSVGLFFNSIHFWAVQVFFVFMVLHLWGQYFAASWRDGRALTWVVGVIVFLVSIVAAFTGYLSQQNFASQWIAVNAKDAINSIGAGWVFNVLNFGQMYGLHIALIPVAIILLVGFHLVLVRMRGVVKPIARKEAAR